MSVETADTIIIGAGLSGLYAARLLSSRRNHALVVLEARNRVGGRILSPEHHGFFSDLGPSWYWPDIHPNMWEHRDALYMFIFERNPKEL